MRLFFYAYERRDSRSGELLGVGNGILEVYPHEIDSVKNATALVNKMEKKVGDAVDEIGDFDQEKKTSDEEIINITAFSPVS